ncbi:casparian strip membrane protein 1 isoform X2 [Lotus japonicus]|nr:casparian strip membrane protein 1 isoform X2 [Lotus japonicus]
MATNQHYYCMDEFEESAYKCPVFSHSSSSIHSILSKSFEELRFILVTIPSFEIKMKSSPAELISEAKSSTQNSKMKRAVSVLDFILRLIAVVATLASAIAMGTTDESLPFFTQFIRFRAEYDDLPTLRLFVVASAFASGYLILSLPLSILHITRSSARRTRVILIILDMVMLTSLTAASSAAAAIVYLAHKGNAKANWFAFCQQYDSFCERISGSLIGSFIAIPLFIMLILFSALVLSKR